jgi:alpha-amylase/alpha-mannosidase (GH57 family)
MNKNQLSYNRDALNGLYRSFDSLYKRTMREMDFNSTRELTDDFRETLETIYTDFLLTKNAEYSYHVESVLISLISKLTEYEIFIDTCSNNVGIGINIMIKRYSPKCPYIRESKNRFFTIENEG